MKKRALVIVVVVASLAAGSPAVAQAERIPIDAYGVACELYPGETWFTGVGGQVIHVRGRISAETFFDATSFAEIGRILVTGNFDLNLATGAGGFNVVFSGFFDDFSEVDPFIGSVGGSIHEFLSYGRVAGRGTGELKNVKIKARVETALDIPDEIWGLVPCPPDQLAWIIRDRGYFLDAR